MPAPQMIDVAADLVHGVSRRRPGCFDDDEVEGAILSAAQEECVNGNRRSRKGGFQRTPSLASAPLQAFRERSEPDALPGELDDGL